MKNSKVKIIITSMAAGIAGFHGAQVLAQSAPGRALEEIVVTAQKRSQNINEVGMAITAQTGDQLVERGVTAVQDLVKIEPSLQASKSKNGTPVFSMRGVGYFEQSLAATPTVSLYQDQVPFTLPVMAQGVFLDVERVEILKGPQGTLFGQNATGGAVNFIAAQPTDAFEAGLDTSVTRFDEVSTSAFVSGSLSPTFTARLAVAVEKGGAWQESITHDGELGDKDKMAGRLILNWEPTDTFKANLNVNGWSDKSDTQAGQLVGFRFQQPQNVLSGDPSNNAFYLPPAPGSAEFSSLPSVLQEVLRQPVTPNEARDADWDSSLQPENDMNYHQVSMRLEYALTDGIDLTSITSYAEFEENNLLDVSGNKTSSHNLRVDGSAHSFSQEFRLSGILDEGDANWMLGVNYAHDANGEVDSVNELGSVSYSPTAFGLDPFFGFGAINSVESDTYSVFANGDYQVAEDLKLNLGIRYTKSEQEFNGCSTSEFDSVNFLQQFVSSLSASAFGNPGDTVVTGECVTLGPPPEFLLGNVRNELNENNVPWRVGLDWTPTDDSLVYLTVSKGFKAGTSPALGAAKYNQLDPVTQEELLAYEVGTKAMFLDGSMQVKGAVFKYDYTDKQQLGTIQDPVFGAVQALLNIPESEVTGAEMSVEWMPLSSLSLHASATYLDSEVTSDFFNGGPFPIGSNQINFKGEDIPLTPEWSLQYGARYEGQINDNLISFVSIDGSHQTSTNAVFGAGQSQITGAPSMAIDSYTLLNLAVGLGALDDSWRVEIFGQNITDEYYWKAVNYNADSVYRFSGEPTNYGVRLKLRY
ncbi:MAG: TonB-dependent receptor [Porticoccaceae bacterium]|nr:TonB-dependent receptor [Porticoccaceae bacterium]